VNSRVKEALDRYIDNISSIDGVLEVYLFGSHANGTPSEDSDLDLMVVVEDGIETLKIAIKIRTGLIGKMDIPLDLLVNNKKDFEAAANELAIQKQIKEEGVLVYDKCLVIAM